MRLLGGQRTGLDIFLVQKNDFESMFRENWSILVLSLIYIKLRYFDLVLKGEKKS